MKTCHRLCSALAMSAGLLLVAPAHAQPAQPAPDPAAEQPAAEQPAAEQPAAETPPAETPVAETPVAETPVELPAVEDEGDDDWETDTGPVDKSVHLSGVLQASWRSTLYDDEMLPDGSELEDRHTFQVEHTHIKFSGEQSHKLSWEVMPCVTHMNDFSVITANFTYTARPELQVTFGRFLLPFGQFNERSLPGLYETVSRPLLYQSHEDDMIQAGGNLPTNFIFTPRDDEGLLLQGSKWFGDEVQLSYSAYLTNGLRAISDQRSRFWNDNNNGKQAGGRVGVSYNGDKLAISAGGSFLANRYEDEDEDEVDAHEALDQMSWGVDAVLSYQYATGRRVLVRGEYVDSTREIVPTAELLSGDDETSGAYVLVFANLTDKLAAYYQFDTLSERTPMAQLDEGFRDLDRTTNRHTAGLRMTVAGSISAALEYGRWIEPLGVPDAHRVSAQTVLTF